MKTLGEIVDAVLRLNHEEQRFLIQMIELKHQPNGVKTETQKSELFENGRLTYTGIQGIMDELNATLDSPNL